MILRIDNIISAAAPMGGPPPVVPIAACQNTNDIIYQNIFTGLRQFPFLLNLGDLCSFLIHYYLGIRDLSSCTQITMV